MAPDQGGFVGLPLPRCAIMSQRSVKWLIHLFQFAPLKSGMTTSIWRQEGTHGTETKTSYARMCLRDSSCDGSDHPSDHNARFGCAKLVTDLPSSTYASVLRRSTSFLPPTLDARRRVAVTTAGSVALRSLHGRTHSMSRHLADGTSVKTRVVPASTRYSYSPKRGSISGLHHGTLRPHASARWE